MALRARLFDIEPLLAVQRRGERFGSRAMNEENRFRTMITSALFESSMVRALLYRSYFLFRFGLGQWATMTVEIPPLGLKSPFTSAHTGRAQRTTSSST